VVAGFLGAVVENLNSADILTVQAAFAVAITENVVLADRFGVGGWVKIITTQNPNWTNITDTQSANWQLIDNSQ
jgi:hypothetical protein